MKVCWFIEDFFSLTGIKNALPSTTKFIVGCKSVGSVVKKLRPWSSNMAMENGAGWWFGTWILFSIIKKGCHPSRWGTPSFFRGVGRKTTKQWRFLWENPGKTIYSMEILHCRLWWHRNCSNHPLHVYLNECPATKWNAHLSINHSRCPSLIHVFLVTWFARKLST